MRQSFFVALVATLLFAACGDSGSQSEATVAAPSAATKSIVREKHLSSYGQYGEHLSYYMIVDEAGGKKRSLVKVPREMFTSGMVGDTILIKW